MRSKIITIGIAPWGMVHGRAQLLGKQRTVVYDKHSLSHHDSQNTLNDRHAYFLLADNGTIGRRGADLELRDRIECYMSKKNPPGNSVPVVCVALGGGFRTLDSIHGYLTR